MDGRSSRWSEDWFCRIPRFQRTQNSLDYRVSPECGAVIHSPCSPCLRVYSDLSSRLWSPQTSRILSLLWLKCEGCCGLDFAFSFILSSLVTRTPTSARHVLAFPLSVSDCPSLPPVLDSFPFLWPHEPSGGIILPFLNPVAQRLPWAMPWALCFFNAGSLWGICSKWRWTVCCHIIVIIQPTVWNRLGWARNSWGWQSESRLLSEEFQNCQIITLEGEKRDTEGYGDSASSRCLLPLRSTLLQFSLARGSGKAQANGTQGLPSLPSDRPAFSGSDGILLLVFRYWIRDKTDAPAVETVPRFRPLKLFAVLRRIWICKMDRALK